MKLQGKVAVVTGGAVRLGRAMTMGLAEQGVRVCMHYGSSADAAAETLEIIRAGGGTAISIQADLRDPISAASEVIEHACNQFGAVDILINNAAIFESNSIETASEDVWDRHFAINLKAPFFLCQTFAKQLKVGQESHIVNIADWRVFRPSTEHMIYTMTKSSLVSLTNMLAQYLAPNVQVNAIALGAILPPPHADEAYLDRIAQNIPLRRSGQPGDVVRSLLFLLQSDFITGEVLRITGGEEL